MMDLDEVLPHNVQIHHFANNVLKMFNSYKSCCNVSKQKLMGAYSSLDSSLQLPAFLWPTSSTR